MARRHHQTRDEGSDHDPQLPSGVLTVMFTDLEDSTPRWEIAPDEMRRVMNVHDEVLDRAIRSVGGTVFKSTGDGVGAVFASPSSAVEAAITIQRQLQMVPWPGTRPKVRIGLHLGDITPTRGDYYGAEVNRAARIMDVTNGDQIGVSARVASFLAPEVCVAIGEHWLRGIGAEDIHLVRHDDIVFDERPLRTDAVPGHNLLPASTSPSIGRGPDVAALVSLLEEKRLVTIVGPGGVGKTHVSLEVGRQIETNFRDGAVFIGLSDVSGDDAVLDVVAAAIGARVQPGLDLLASISDFFEGRELLVILDNCEHVSDEANQLVERIIDLPGVSVLSTSRSPLGLAVEQVVPLGPLSTTADGVDLFIERASRRDPTFDPNPEQRKEIADICALVDRIPLGIELAAAWVRVLSLDHIRSRLDASFDIGRPGARAANSRHETLQATIDWSYGLLDDAEKQLFNHMSVFAGGFSLDAVEAICVDGDNITTSDVAAIVMALVDKSMLHVERRGGEPRFVMLRTLRMFGASQLRTSTRRHALSARHASYYASLVSRAAEQLISQREHEIWALLDLEWPNIREAFVAMKTSGQVGDAASLVLDLGWFSTLSLRSEPFAWADELVQSNDSERIDGLASLYGLRAIHKYFTVDTDSRSDAEQGLSLDPADPNGYCRIALGAVWLKNQHVDHESNGWTTAWLDSLSNTSPPMSQLWAHGMRAFHLCVHDPSSPEALERVETIESIAANSGSTSALVMAHWARGMHIVSTCSEDVEIADIGDALTQWHTGLDVAGSLSSVHLIADLIIGLELHFTAAHGDLETALRTCRHALRSAHEHHYLAGTSHLLGVTAIVLARVGRADVGRQLLPVMVANGHVPRSNVLAALGADVDAHGLQSHRRSLTIHQAAELADETLTRAIDAFAPFGSNVDSQQDA